MGGTNASGDKGKSAGYNPSYDTPLGQVDEVLYRIFKKQYAPTDPGADYDYRGAYAAGQMPVPPSGHWTDKFKKPGHETFSEESQYAGAQPEKAGRWEGDRYIPHAPNVIIPDTGAAKYWYVDPRATGTYSPGNNLNQTFNPTEPSNSRESEYDQKNAIMDALQRMFEAGQSPSSKQDFSF